MRHWRDDSLFSTALFHEKPLLVLATIHRRSAYYLLLLTDKVGWVSLPILERLEWQAYDLKVRSTLSEQADPSLAIIDIDERSLYEIGQWPWPRATVAELVNTLFTEYDAGLFRRRCGFLPSQRSRFGSSTGKILSVTTRS